MIQRDKIMEQLMFKKITPTFFINENNNIIANSKTYQVSPSLPDETVADALKMQIQLNTGIGVNSEVKFSRF